MSRFLVFCFFDAVATTGVECEMMALVEAVLSEGSVEARRWDACAALTEPRTVLASKE